MDAADSGQIEKRVSQDQPSDSGGFGYIYFCGETRRREEDKKTSFWYLPRTGLSAVARLRGADVKP